jgi:hypothetical protein
MNWKSFLILFELIHFDSALFLYLVVPITTSPPNENKEKVVILRERGPAY